ncbi:Uncharacterized protein TPAR_01979 [Tolypocladium paradoxum]|uniref:Uncharacterized protein n=1 Tax=Tolypocladium paradoxum TaxID=94208 RepID=A0A2S4L5V4_9HYPO|nr:Uncharacterized protein TPAR_01979 [Tolypocladium paradoxum]
MPERKARPARSNSFQRMLELERQYMLERLQASKPQQQPSSSTSSPPERESPPRSSIQARRAEFRPPTTPEARSEDASPARRPAPLVINTAAASPRSETAVKRQRDAPVVDDVPTAVATPVEKPSPKVVAFEFPPKEMDQRSICVSPSWESHGRRKKEKKMMEKKEREERKEKEKGERKDKDKEEAARNAESRGRKRPARLSKQPPPASSTDALHKVERTAPAESTAGARGRQKERPTSHAGLTSPMEDDAAAPRKPRSRSGSFASLIRSPFGGRRSVDPSAEPEFVGGIKLELERHLAHERALNEQAKADEANIHPALRTDKPNRRWSGPLKSPPPPARGPGDPKDASRRAYPPITRHGKATKTQSLISPTAPVLPDLSKMDKWRQRVGLKTTSKADSTDTEQDTVVGDSNKNGGESTQDKDAPPKHDTKAKADANIPPSGSTSPVATEAPTTEAKRGIAKQPNHIAFAQALPPMDLNGENRENADLSNNESIPSSSDSRSNGYRTAPSTPPLEPPRRSSKRNSLLSLTGSIPPLPSPTETTHALISSPSEASLPGRSTPEEKSRTATTTDAVSTNSLTPKASELSNARLAFRTASPEAVRRATPSPPLKPAETAHTGSPTQKSSSKNLRHAPMSSSEDSCSEEFHSPSPPSTPATSRPQSEKGLPLLSNSDKGFTLDFSMPKTLKDSGKKPASVPEPMDDEDEIQATADKALASFCEIAMGRRGLQRRTNSESMIAANQGLVPVPRHQPLRFKEKSMLSQTNRLSAPAGNQAWRPPTPLRDQSPRPSPRPSPAPVPAPAVYLEEARKLAPAAPPARVSKQRLGPPASFILPGDLPSPSVLSEASRSTDAISRSLRLTSTPSLGQLEREPIAKVFVECCGCKFYHDMPSHLYEAMANPEGVLKPRDTLGYAGAVSMTVKCPWCKHEMSTKCCAGLAAMVYVTERLH